MKFTSSRVSVVLLPVGLLSLALHTSTPQPSKIDPPLLEAMEAGRSARVIVLGKTQLFEPVGGPEAFQREHAEANRLELREEVIATLKANAAREQARILEALGRAEADRALWILNALSMELTPEEIRVASRLDEVLFIYAGGEEPRAQRVGGPPILVVPESEPNPAAPDQGGSAAAPTFDPADKSIAWNVRHLNAPSVWTELVNTGEGAVIAVLDNGANYAHTDLRTHLWRNPGEVPNNDLDDDGNGWIDDVYGYDMSGMTPDVRNTDRPRQHGTMTSGIALGDGTGGTITGVAPGARLMLLKLTGDNVDRAGDKPIAAALAYEYAIENGADILSMSFSLPRLGNLRGFWRMMSDHAVAAGLFLVGGAGNFRETEPIPIQHQSPKDVPSVISVGGIDTLGALVSFSSMGPAEWSTVALYGDYPMPEGIVKPDVSAFPGSGFPVLGLEDVGYIDTDTLRIRGNSFSGPQVAGVAAFIFSEFPTLPVWRVREVIESTAKDLGEPGKDNQFGYGLVDAHAALLRAREVGGGG